MTPEQPDYHVVIPARHASSRFPGKILVPLNGRPMLLHVVDRALESAARQVVVATDDARIASVCRGAGVEVVMTREDHPSGTDRIAEVADTLHWSDDTLIVGLQGDEPTTLPSSLDLLARNLALHADADMTSLCTRVASVEEYLNVNRVKVVRDARGMALYFSRAPIPYRRDRSVDMAAGSFPESFVHVGLYAYRCGYLKQYSALAPASIEQEESLEQLRVLFHGGRIHVDEIASTSAHGVDHPEDVPVVEALLRARMGNPATG